MALFVNEFYVYSQGIQPFFYATHKETKIKKINNKIKFCNNKNNFYLFNNNNNSPLIGGTHFFGWIPWMLEGVGL